METVRPGVLHNVRGGLEEGEGVWASRSLDRRALSQLSETRDISIHRFGKLFLTRDFVVGIYCCLLTFPYLYQTFVILPSP
jgi:hypothetical protein